MPRNSRPRQRHRHSHEHVVYQRQRMAEKRWRNLKRRYGFWFTWTEEHVHPEDAARRYEEWKCEVAAITYIHEHVSWGAYTADGEALPDGWPLQVHLPTQPYCWPFMFPRALMADRNPVAGRRDPWTRAQHRQERRRARKAPIVYE